jgi:uncharacterized membrane protein YkoI
MFNRKKVIASALLLTVATGLAGSAIAQTAPGNAGSVVAQNATQSTSPDNASEVTELQAIQSAKLTIAQAAQAAEKETGGKAVDVSIGDENGQIAYQVEVALGDGTKKEVHIDTQTGQVIKVSADEEHRDGGDQEDGEDSEN